ncbi:MAG TPA: homocysteine S-methyltransferase family protein [Bryobacteraceae bacterium]|nr:homocysteine S-methyltransferase family protein [Bryobacteraceae bacterium]
MIPAEWMEAAPLLADGAWGTELQKLGLAPGGCADEWNLSHREEVGSVARAYREAGSRIVLTNTFRANRIALAPYGLADRTDEINRAGVEISRGFAPGALVFASIGPSGRLLIGEDISAEALAEAFGEQAAALWQGGADALLIETMSDPEEARIAIVAAKSTGLPVIASFAFESGRNHDRTMMGATPERCATVARGAGADAVGANCGIGMEQAAGLCHRLSEASGLPVWIKPNAGMPSTTADGALSYPATPEEFAASVPALVEAGAMFIGGCCGSDPRFIRAMCAALRP